MINFYFDPKTTSIVLPVRLEYKRGYRANLLLDTGATFTVITPRVAEELGYNLSYLSTASLLTASCEESVYKLVLNSISLFTEKITNLDARCMPLPSELKIDGLLGLNFLKYFNININFEKGILTFKRISYSI